MPVIFYNRTKDYEKIKSGRGGAMTVTRFSINKEDEVVVNEKSDLMLRKKPQLDNLSNEIKAEAKRKMIAEIVALTELPHTSLRMVSIEAIVKRVCIKQAIFLHQLSFNLKYNVTLLVSKQTLGYTKNKFNG